MNRLGKLPRGWRAAALFAFTAACWAVIAAVARVSVL